MARAKQIQEKRAQKRVDASGGDRTVATNRRARYDYEIIETLECGIMLSGSEVKSLREGKAQIAESYARFDDNELWLYQMHVPPWLYAVGFGSHDPDRRRKLLARRHELDQWLHETRTEPYTMVPLKVYFTGGKAKVELALVKGKKSQDRRQAIAKRDAERDIARAVRHAEKYDF
jgi:SsrA-binding protein